MTVIFRDVHDGLNLSRGTLDGLSFTELLYADDTVLITNNVNAMNRLLRNVEKCARYHGLSFNKDKCVSMNFHCEAKTKYADGTKVPCSDAVTYLGAELTKLGSARKEINRKISQCIVICKKLQMFWRNPSCPTKFKLHVYDAVIRSKLVYGLESLHLNAGTLSHLNAFQLKGLRRILNLKHTFIDRSNTNHKILQTANRIKNPKNIEGKNVALFSDYVLKQQNSLLAHTIRASPEDPLRQCTLSSGSIYPFEVTNRRVGRPRNNWTFKTYERMAMKNTPANASTFKHNPTLYMDMMKTSILNRTVTVWKAPIASAVGVKRPTILCICVHTSIYIVLS